MRVWIVGLFCALLGAFAAWTGFVEEAWLFAFGGVALLVASLAYIVRPGRKRMGLIQVCWGALILGHAARSGQGVSFDTARSSGSSAAYVVAVLMVIVGVINLTRASNAPARTVS
jgi:hypothetical protein